LVQSGLGTGISAAAFQRHGISITIVEIDPAVYDAARTFFGLPDPGPSKVFLEDAKSWVATQRGSFPAGSKEARYDFVVHDLFSGGGVPEQLFTLEFWEDLKAILTPEGVVVVVRDTFHPSAKKDYCLFLFNQNFAGIPKSDSSKMVLLTLEKSFGQCRGFHDNFEPLLEEKYATEFVNIVSGSMIKRYTMRND
jgi:predicted membrane-bound spermidine synthase